MEVMCPVFIVNASLGSRTSLSVPIPIKNKGCLGMMFANMSITQTGTLNNPQYGKKFDDSSKN